MYRLNSVFGAGLCLALSVSAVAQTDEANSAEVMSASRALDAFETRLHDETNIPAYGVAVVTCRSIDVRIGGVRQTGQKEPIRSGANFNIGSNAKSMLATAAARLQERGALSLDASLRELWPELAAQHPDKADITLAQLLSHTSGLPAFDKGSELDLVPEFAGEPHSIRAAAPAWFLAQPLASHPGSETIYSNAGYVVAGHLLERVSGQSLPDLLQAEVFEPIGITAALGEPRNMSGSQPMGHYMSGDQIIAYTDPEAPIPTFLEAAGNVSLTPFSYARYLQAHLCALEGERDFLAPEIASVLHSPVSEGSSALGWGVVDLRGATTSFHIGGTGDFTAYAALSADTGKGALAVFNLGGGATSIAQEWLVDVVTSPATVAIAGNPPTDSAIAARPITSTPEGATTPETESLAQQFAHTAERLGIDGLAYAVVSDGALVEKQSLGISGKRSLLTDQTLRIASVTKALTGVVLAQLASEGALDLDSEVLAMLPDARVPQGVTIRHLASHTSETQPGSGFVYATNRYALLERVIEKATGQSLEQALIERIIEPSGMTWHTSPDLGSHAGLVSSVDDMARFALAMQQHKLLDADAFEDLSTPFELNNGRSGPVSLGFFVQEIAGQKVLWSFGQDDPDHSSSLLMHLPDRELTFFLMANTDALSNPFRLLMGDIRTSPFALSFLDSYAPDLAPRIPAVDRTVSEILVHAWAGNHPSALEMFERLKRASPQAFLEPSRLALHFVATNLQQENDETIDQFDRLVLQDHPLNRWALLASAEYHSRMGRDDLAMDRFQNIIDLPNQDDNFLRRLFLAWSLGGQGKIMMREDKARAHILFEAALATGVTGQTRDDLVSLRDEAGSR